MKAKISDAHRKELLRFLLLKTAGVRCGVKPGELLRVQHCYSAKSEGGFPFCLYREDILQILKLQYIELQVNENSSLILFYHPEKLTETLSRPENRAFLFECGYPVAGNVAEWLDELKRRFVGKAIPHEVGVFIGYPVKDVKGFIQKLPRAPLHRPVWAVFGDVTESLSLMRLYRRAETFAQSVLDACDDLQAFFDQVTNLNKRKQAHEC